MVVVPMVVVSGGVSVVVVSVVVVSGGVSVVVVRSRGACRSSDKFKESRRFRSENEIVACTSHVHDCKSHDIHMMGWKRRG